MATGSRNTGGGTAVAQAAPRRDFLQMLDLAKPELARLLPDDKAVERVVRIARTAYQMTGGIRECEPGSIVASVMKAAELGLEPGGALKHAWLVPYNGQCTFQLSYFGMLELARRSAAFKAIEARLVHQADHFSVRYTPEAVFDHVPRWEPERGPETHVYAYARLNNGALVLEVMTRAEVEHVRASSKCGPVWKNHWGEMAKKTVIKRMLKRQPLSVELAEAVEFDNRLDRDAIGGEAPRRALPGASRAEQMAAALDPPEEPAFAEGTASRIGTEADDDRPADEFEDEPGSKG
jgi:recombination protein RecT